MKPYRKYHFYKLANFYLIGSWTAIQCSLNVQNGIQLPFKFQVTDQSDLWSNAEKSCQT